MLEDIVQRKPRVIGQVVQSVNELKSTVSEVIPSPQEAEAWGDFIDHRIRKIGDTLRTEMEDTCEKYRSEMQQVFDQARSEMRRQALYQWLTTIAIVVGVVGKFLLG